MFAGLKNGHIGCHRTNARLCVSETIDLGHSNAIVREFVSSTSSVRVRLDQRKSKQAQMPRHFNPFSLKRKKQRKNRKGRKT